MSCLFRPQRLLGAREEEEKEKEGGDGVAGVGRKLGVEEEVVSEREETSSEIQEKRPHKLQAADIMVLQATKVMQI